MFVSNNLNGREQEKFINFLFDRVSDSLLVKVSPDND
jgi:hypothetical protein